MIEDAFKDLARYYDPLMAHVNYDRWEVVVRALAGMLPEPFVHLDAACGTATLIKRLRRTGWTSVGCDLSPAMVRAGKKGARRLPVAVADLRALPFRNVDFVTCLFDSFNFLLAERDFRKGLREVARALRPQGLFYFDVVTERMVLEHFEDQRWSERTGRISSDWDSRYHRGKGLSETIVKVNRGAESVIRERMYPREFIEQAIADAGLTLIGSFDAETWKAPTKKTLRIDYLACAGDATPYTKPIKQIAQRIRLLQQK
ncbi:MAG TPA: class I SAM-dependent methyltransferase [Candidatus Hydrogenedentes bacterium]|nr:class I SAM-dependent methyltransferase [Candidatus Hydrogenedentota bacterium]HOS04031.1 class I SAM-dependent methyltransferase [Candidatus Hydrogenedentota bacterium]